MIKVNPSFSAKSNFPKSIGNKVKAAALSLSLLGTGAEAQWRGGGHSHYRGGGHRGGYAPGLVLPVPVVPFVQRCMPEWVTRCFRVSPFEPPICVPRIENVCRPVQVIPRRYYY